MDALKYIVTDRGAFAIFNGLQAHSDVARSLHGKPVGAGFVHFINLASDERSESGHTFKLLCFGRSVSLGLDSRGDVDSEIIGKNL